MAQSDAGVSSASMFTEPFSPWSTLSGILIKIKIRFAPIVVLCFLKTSRIICNGPCIYSPTSVRWAELILLAVWARSPAWRSQLLLEEQERRQLVCGTGVPLWCGDCSCTSWAKGLQWKLWWTSCTATALVLGDSWVLYRSEGFKFAFFLVCTWSRETTELMGRYKHTQYLCMCEFLPKSFTCICKGQNLSIRCSICPWMTESKYTSREKFCIAVN